ncbi:MAG: GNAT family N-acetyltransferase [Ilumatobacteraceae bacterium]
MQLTTDRLTIRMLSREDVTAFTHYRKLPAVARYQGWPRPYTRDLAHELVDEMDALDGPTPDAWVQLALDEGGRLVGDVAVWLDTDADLAMIGYTLDPQHQGRGLAVEAVEAVIEWLFGELKVHRVAATIDPLNLPSARVLERCGFEYVGTARSSALIDGEWTDDARFSLLAPDWAAWTERETEPPDRVDLVEITDANLEAVLGVHGSFSQRRLVAPVLHSLAQALVPPVEDGESIRPWYRGVSADGAMVGFVMVAEPTTVRPDPELWRLLIDRHHQGRGIGTRVVEAIVERRAQAGDTRLTVRYAPDGAGSPARFYERLGFVPSGDFDGGEMIASLELSRFNSTS